MPLNLTNFLQAPMVRGINPGLGDMFSGGINAYQQAQKHREMMQEQAMKNALMQQYGPREKEADISYKENLAQYYGQGGRGQGGSNAQSEGLRIWRSLPPDIRNDMLAQGNAWGFSPEEVAMAISGGKNMNDLKEAARARGIDVENAEKMYVPTGRTRSNINELEGYRAELKVLENEYRDDVKDYNNYLVFGYNPSQVIDQIKGQNPDKQAKFLAKRALLSAMAGVRTRIEGGSNAQEALHDLREKSLGETKIFRSLVDANVYDLTQKYIDQALDKGADARIRAMKGIKKPSRGEGEALRKELSGPTNPSMNQNAPIMGRIRDKTGQYKIYPIRPEHVDAFRQAGGDIIE